MSFVLHNKYVYDASGRVVEVIIPFHEFQELQRRIAKHSVELHALAGEPANMGGELSATEMTQIALQGGAFDWLKDEPDIYSDADGEPV